MDIGEAIDRIREAVDSSGIKALHKIYFTIEKGLEPREKDIFTALDMLEGYYSDFLQYCEEWTKEDEPKQYKKELPVIQEYKKRLSEIRSALKSTNEKQMLIALDNAINQWHIDYPVILHLQMEFEGHDDYDEMCDLTDNIEEILRRLGRLPEEGPYSSLRDE